ncbi:hypothetical protein AV530_007063 [Patagioenas fasciata monilis]|uniref:THD domain-containing protein n=1 Tax=Patagioenas fasciata monilis TaxID=372326 RepID=A0A1V4KK66_PATFA|nr:hypothetical protein AV530_007063 [Patagioenas fasciata monilis]
MTRKGRSRKAVSRDSVGVMSLRGHRELEKTDKFVRASPAVPMDALSAVTVSLVTLLLAVAAALAALAHRLGLLHQLLHPVDPRSPRHGGELVAAVLKAHGVRFVFALAGGHISPILVACEKIGINGDPTKLGQPKILHLLTQEKVVAMESPSLGPVGSLSPSGPLLRYETGINGAFLSGDIQVTSPRELLVTSGGLYLLYGQFALSCAATECPQGTVTLQLRRRGSQQPLLAVTVTMTPGTGSGPARSGLSQAVGQLEPGDVLSLALVGDTIGDNGDNDGDGWQLEQDEREGNFVGLLRIAGG